MRNLRKAVVVAAMVGSMGMFGAGVATAGGQGDGDAPVNNPQFMNCSYSGNTSTGLTQIASVVVDAGSEEVARGDASNSATLGNVCTQTAPTFGG